MLPQEGSLERGQLSWSWRMSSSLEEGPTSTDGDTRGLKCPRSQTSREGVRGLRGFGTRQRRRVQKSVEVMTQNMSKTSCPPKLLHISHPRSRTSWK